jgi:hypothetical protein
MNKVLVTTVGIAACIALLCACGSSGQDETDKDLGGANPDASAVEVTQDVPGEVLADLPSDAGAIDLRATDLPGETAQDSQPDLAEPGIAALQFGPFQQWASPVQDYIDVNTEVLGHTDFMFAIHAMAVFQDRLYFGYGDANLNLGHNTPIEIRYFTQPEPEAHTFDFITDEEQISSYRIDGDLLMIPGVDATQDGLMGNAYTMSTGGSWYKSRTLEFGWHVHDILRIGDDLYACGSGGTGDDYQNSTVNAFVWQSIDGGETFQIHVQSPHPEPPGDHRYVHLLKAGNQVYVFGYYSDQYYSYGLSYRLSDGAVELWDEMLSFFTTNTIQVSDDLGLVAGVIIADPMKFGVVKVTPDGAEPSDMLVGNTLLAGQPLGDGRAVLLYQQGDKHPGQVNGPWAFHVGLYADGQVAKLASLVGDTHAVSVAFWRNSLYLGLTDGTIWRAQGH